MGEVVTIYRLLGLCYLIELVMGQKIDEPGGDDDDEMGSCC